MATIRDVAKKSGVGLGTVSRVLNGTGSVKPETREKVLEVMKELNYTPNEVARNFKKQSTKFIGLLIPTVWHPFFSELAFYIEDESYKNDYKLMLCNSEGKKEKEIQYLEMLKQNQVAGIIILSYHNIDKYIDPKMRVVTIDRYFSKKVPYVASDNYTGGKIATETLINNGCKYLGYLGGGSTVATAVFKRKEAFIDTVEKNKVKYCILEDLVKVGYERELAKKFLDKYPEVDGVFTSTDMFAGAFISEARERGKRIPEDIQVIGYDGIQTNDYFHPILSTIRQPVEEIARSSVEILINQINGVEVPEELVLPVLFKKGETTV